MKSRALCLACDFHSAEANFNCKQGPFPNCKVVVSNGWCTSNYITMVQNDTMFAQQRCFLNGVLQKPPESFSDKV